ncbi:sugar O-acetyltransferase [Lapidilactobacillus luobeiensis]|uniref:sugar O-acetyltransferase n=1 Tax=Lapidilactobacillus luobeiensis TaxID=2950371 RepID=UPI0021C4844B|nr:sugar O-acetyltransferase [Lapidilactobacillus luobeiensis]
MDLTEIKRRMASGELYLCEDPQLLAEQAVCLDQLFQYNQLPPSRRTEKAALLQQMFAHFGSTSYLETPFHANWGGKYVTVGEHVYANFNLTLVDDAPITIEDYVLLGPNVVLCSGTHPIDPSLRRDQLQYNGAIHLGENVWLGANTVVLPGVTIGANTVVGAGSVVTKDLPADVVAVGSPCRVLRAITAADRQKFPGTIADTECVEKP